MNARRWSLIWLIAVPVVVGTIAGFVVSWRTPLRYRSQAVIMVIPHRLETGYIQPIPPRALVERIAVMEQPILSRTRLERLAVELNLFEEERKTMIMEEVIESFRKNIEVRAGGTGRASDTFTVEYTGTNPLATLKVTEKLAGFFIEESLRDGARRAEGSIAYLEAQSEDLGRRLTAAIAANKGTERERIEIEVLRSTYTKLLTNLEDARMRGNMENRQLGERFTLIDQARLPEKPINATRTQASAIGALMGLSTGVLLALGVGLERLRADRKSTAQAVL